eukprot:scaffold16496_cov69-Attheya_sp.AAC.2
MLMWTGLSVVWMVLMGGPLVEAFGSITSRNHISRHALRRGLIVQKMTGDLDFEYIPPPHNSGDTNKVQQLLPSVFPKGTPAGLRGEAVRSALLSERGICMDVSSSSSSSSSSTHQTSHLATGVLQVKGEGTASFLHSKFSQSFRKPNVSQQHNNNKGT